MVVKYLSIYYIPVAILIDEVLAWNKQIDVVCTMLARANGLLLNLCHFVPKKIVYQYISFYFTLMFYMVFWFGPTQQPNIIVIGQWAAVSTF